jgi:hypothetical protein
MAFYEPPKTEIYGFPVFGNATSASYGRLVGKSFGYLQTGLLDEWESEPLLLIVKPKMSSTVFGVAHVAET